MIFLSLPAAPIAAPQQLTVMSKNSTSLSLTWNPPPFEDTNGLIQYYTILIIELDTGTSLPTMNPTIGQATFNNLHPYYAYQCRVAAFTIDIGPYTPAITVQLDQAGESNTKVFMMIRASKFKSLKHLRIPLVQFSI